MRLAFNTFPNSLVTQLNALRLQQTQLQNQAATGRRISQVDDDPAAMQRVLQAQAQDARVGQYRSNITALQERATASYNSIQGLHTISTRAGEIATLADGTKSPAELQVYAQEVSQLIQQGVQLMNSKFQGEYLFGGTLSDKPPFVATTDASGNVTAVTYQGNDTVSSAEIAAGSTLSVQNPGANTSGSGPVGLITDSRTGADFFNHLIALQNDLQSGDVTAISSSDFPALSKDEDNITLQMGYNGVTQAHLEAADSIAAAQSSSLTQAISQDATVDLAQTLTQLSATQTAYQAALQSGAGLLNESQTILDYLQ